MSPTSYQAALPRVIPSLLSATLIIIPYSNGFVNRVRKVFLQRKQRMKTRLLTFFPESQQARQFTPLREGRRPCPHQHCSRSCYFNSRPSARGDKAQTSLYRSSTNFNSRPSARGDISRASDVMRKTYFNSRPSARGDKAYIIKCWKITYFNSRPSARGDRKIKTIDDPNDLFQFTPLREGRRAMAGRSCAKPHFNSRPSARGD